MGQLFAGILSLIFCSVAFAGASAAIAGRFAAPNWPNVHSPEADRQAEEIFQARLEQWADRTFGFDVYADCKYASAIPTAAPAGRIALTFDDGPDPKNHSLVLNVLKRHNVKATFFFVGKEASANIGLVADILPDGHFAASHSWDHANFHKLSNAKQAKQVTDAERVLKPYMGSQMYFRYPYGNSSCATNAFLKGRGYKFVGWHVDTCDWGFNKTGSVSAAVGRGCGVKASNMNNYVNHVLDTIRAEGGGIVLLHEVQPNTLAKLEEIIVELKREGYQFVNLNASEMQSSLW